MIESSSRKNFSYNYLHLLTWLVITCFYSLQMTLRILPAITADYFTTKLGMNAEEYGMLAGFYYIGYAGMQIPIGLLIDKFHPRYIVPGCILLFIFGILITTYTESKNMLYLARIMIGIGSVGGILGATKAIDDFFPSKYSLFLGFTVLTGIAGSFYGGSPIKKSIDQVGLEQTLLAIVYVGLFLSISIMFLYKKSHSDKISERITIRKIIDVMLTNKRLWILGILGGLMVGPMGGFADTWCSKYLHEVKNLSFDQATFATTMIFLGLGVGSSISGFLFQNCSSYSKLISLMGIMQIIIMLTLFYNNINSGVFVYLLTFSIGFLSSYQIAVFALAHKISNNHLTGVVTSLINSLVMTFCFIFNYSIGLILKLFFITKSPDILIYDKNAYHTSFSFIILCIIMGVIGFVIFSKIEKQKTKKL